MTKDQLSRLLESAARQGDPAAQLEYAVDPMIDHYYAVKNLDRLRAWRDTALAYVKSAVNRGNSQAMIDLAGAYDPLQCVPANRSPCSDMLPLIVEPDAETAYRYYYESKLTGHAPSWIDAEMRTLEEYLTQDQIAAAKMAAQTALAERQ